MDPITSPPAVTTTISAGVESSVSSSPVTSPSASCQKIRLMCSYGGHIVPRPLDKTLCYAGGETRIVAIDRRNAYSLAALTSHLSKSLMNNKQFSLKYQLPNHDLDSLISISTEEDLANMIDEYDRLAGAATSSRLRFFLFPFRSDHELHDPTSEDWFIDALRNIGVVANKRTLSDSGEGQGDIDGKSPKNASGGRGVGDSPESIPLETSLSFGSTSSSASSNSPAIRGGGGDENLGMRLPADFKITVPHVDSVGSDSNTPSPSYNSPHCVTFQDASNFVESKVISTNLVETESNSPDRSPRGDMLTQVPVPSYFLTKPMEQQQHMAPSATTTYIHQPPPSQSRYVTQYYPSSVPVPSYATMYQPYVQPQQTMQYQVNNPQPVYMMSMSQAQSPYDRPIQNTLATAPSVAPTMVAAAPMSYESYNPAGPAQMFLAPTVASHPVSVASDAYPLASQAASAVSAAPLENTNYIGEFEDPLHAQIYKTQPPVPALPCQVQVTTNATAAMMLSETMAQLHVDDPKH